MIGRHSGAGAITAKYFASEANLGIEHYATIETACIDAQDLCFNGAAQESIT